MLLLIMMIMMMDTVSCYVHLHGYGKLNSEPPDDWYRAAVFKGVTYENVAGQRGFYIYSVDPTSCSVRENQTFDTHADDTASSGLITYLDALPTGRFHVF